MLDCIENLSGNARSTAGAPEPAIKAVRAHTKALAEAFPIYPVLPTVHP